MSKVYLVEDVNHATYYGTKKEAKDSQKLEDEPERVQPVDAARELNANLKLIEQLDQRMIDLTCCLRGLIDVAPRDLLHDTSEGREAVKLMKAIDPSFIESCRLEDVL